MSKPKYLVRPDDYMVFSLNDDGETYSIESSKIQFPKHLHHKYSEDALRSCDFFVGREEDFPLYDKKQDEFYKNLGQRGEH